MQKLLIATKNQGKLREFSELLGDVPFELVSLSEVGIEDDVEETGTTFQENASLKAKTYAELSGLLTLADDSGLEIDALGGEPGVYSARYAGEDATDADRIALVHNNLTDKPEPWTARFRCVIAIVNLDGAIQHYTGDCEGRIIREARGSNGFGYDPIFLIPDTGKTMAELSSDEKNRISHRSIAARKASEELKKRVAQP